MPPVKVNRTTYSGPYADVDEPSEVLIERRSQRVFGRSSLMRGVWAVVLIASRRAVISP